MFKIHYSSEQLSQQNADYTIEDTLRKAWASLNRPVLLRKSYGLYHGGKGGDGSPWREWGPADLLHNPPGAQDPAHSLHGWYNQFDADESGSNHVHHPPFGYNRETGELEEHVDKGRAQGRPHTAHPLDAMIGNLGSHYGNMFKSMNMRLQGKNPKQLGMLVAENVFSNAIRKHNEKYGTNLPDIGSAEWRRNHIGAHDKVSQAHERQVRGGTPLEDGTFPLLNYSLNQGNVDMEDSDKGAWIDAGLHHMFEESRKQADMFNATIEKNGLFGSPPVDPSIIPDIGKLSYMNSIKVPLEMMTFQKIQTMNRNEVQQHFVEGSGYIPAHKLKGSRQRGVVENFHPLDIPWIPKGLLAYNPTAGGRPTERGKAVRLKEALENKGIDTEGMNLENLSNTLYTDFLVGGVNRASGGRGQKAMDSLAAHHGVDTGDSDYQSLLAQIQTRGKTEKGRMTHARHLYAIPWMMAINKIRQGMPQEQAWQTSVQELAESDWQHQADGKGHRHIYDEDHHQDVMNMIGQLKETEGHAGQMYQHTGEQFAPRHADHEDHGKHSAPGTGWEEVLHLEGSGKSETADAAHAAARAQLEQAMGRPDQSIQQDSYEQGLEEAQGNLFATSNDRHVSDLLKTMERVQMHDAVNDTFVKSITPSQSYSLSNSTHVGVIAKQLSLANMDIHGIYHSQGDWERVAKDWSVDLSTVKVIKATFGSVDA
jgi:hypothetical protein